MVMLSIKVCLDSNRCNDQIDGGLEGVFSGIEAFKIRLIDILEGTHDRNRSSPIFLRIK